MRAAVKDDKQNVQPRRTEALRQLEAAIGVHMPAELAKVCAGYLDDPQELIEWIDAQHHPDEEANDHRRADYVRTLRANVSAAMALWVSDPSGKNVNAVIQRARECEYPPILDEVSNFFARNWRPEWAACLSIPTLVELASDSPRILDASTIARHLDGLVGWAVRLGDRQLLGRIFEAYKGDAPGRRHLLQVAGSALHFGMICFRSASPDPVASLLTPSSESDFSDSLDFILSHVRDEDDAVALVRQEVHQGGYVVSDCIETFFSKVAHHPGMSDAAKAAILDGKLWRPGTDPEFIEATNTLLGLSGMLKRDRTPLEDEALKAAGALANRALGNHDVAALVADLLSDDDPSPSSLDQMLEIVERAGRAGVRGAGPETVAALKEAQAAAKKRDEDDADDPFA